MRKKFDCEGLLFAVREIERAYKIPLPKSMKEIGFCQVCFGSNVPDFKKHKEKRSKGTFCCGSWCDGLLPAWGICDRFKVDRLKVEALAKSIRPDRTEKIASHTSAS